jgi:predicted MFS family arabinose efflux permease
MTTKSPPARSAALPDDRAVRTTYRSVFAAGEFRILFAALLMYVLGFEFEILGLSVLIFDQTRSPFLTALAFSMGFAPQVIGGALFTSLADRLPPRLVIGTGLLTRSAPGLVIGLWPGLPVPAMLALVAAAATVAPIFTATTSGLLPDILDGDRYVLGRSVFSLTGSGTQILGLGLGGAVLAVWPARWLLAAAGVSLALAAVIIRLGLRRRPAPHARDTGPASGPGSADDPGRAAAARGAPSGSGRGRGVVRTTVAGHLELLADRKVRGLLLAQWLPAWFVTGAEALIVPYTRSLGHPASAASPLLAAVPAGMLLGDVIVGRYCRPAARERLAFPLAAAMGVPLVALLARPPVPLAAAALLVCGFCFAYELGLQRAFLDSLPDGLRGQAFGLNATGGMGGQGLLPPVAGALALAFGAGAAMAIAGLATVLAALALRAPLTGRWGASGPGRRPR